MLDDAIEQTGSHSAKKKMHLDGLSELFNSSENG